jgi:hypothetical protein
MRTQLSTHEEEDEENGVTASSSREPWLAHSARHGSGWGQAAEAGSSDLLGPAAVAQITCSCEETLLNYSQ